MPVPSGVVFEGNDWFYSEFTHSSGVTSLGIEGKNTDSDTAADPEKIRGVLFYCTCTRHEEQ